MKKKILVVDDNRLMLNFLTTTLERKGHQVVSATDGFSALNILTAFSPDIIFVDLIMPKISGDKLCRIVRKMTHLSDCYLVVISAAVVEMDFDFMEIGADACIAKGPFGKMAEHVLAAVEASDAPRREDGMAEIVGLDDVYARQMTKELLSRNRHLQTILESIAEGILEIYSQRIVYANSAAVSLFEMPQEKLLASYFIDLFDNSLRPRLEWLMNPGEEEPREIGRVTPVELGYKQVTLKNLPVKKERSTSILLITDVTERRRLRMQLQHVQKMEAIGTIASGVAHNFRNTLAGILVNSQVLQMTYKDAPELRVFTDRIDTSIKRGVHLVEGLMQFSRKQMENDFQKLNLAEVIQETHLLIKESFDKRIDIQVDTPGSLHIMGDYSGVSLVLMNLCTNARDAMPAGGTLRIEAIKEGNKAVIIVSDTGQGMDQHTVEKCFDPFFTTKEVGKGTGLGLSTTYGIIKSHEGKIHIDSKPNRGTVFKFSFPLVVSLEEIEPEDLSGVKKGNNEKVLIVDDEINLLEGMPDLMKNLGYQASTARNGHEAIEKYKAWQPDVVLMDISMPEMDGITCIEKIAAYDPDVKVVIISGYEKNDPNGLKGNVKRLVKGYLTKPVGIHELSDILTKML